MGVEMSEVRSKGRRRYGFPSQIRANGVVTYTTRQLPADYLKRLRLLTVHYGGPTGRATIQEVVNHVMELGLKDAETELRASLVKKA